MADTVGSRIVIPVSTDASKAVNELSALDKKLNETSKSTSKLAADEDILSGAFSKLGTAAAAFISIEFGKKVLEFAWDCALAAERADDFRMQLTNLTGSAQSANQVIGELRSIQDLGIFTRDEINQGARSLLFMGESADSVGETLRELAAIATGTGQPLQEMISAYERMSITGQVTFRQLRSFGSPVLVQLAKDLYGSAAATDRVQEAVRNGQITFQQFQRAVQATTTGTGAFAQTLKEESGDITSSVTRAENAFARFKRTLGSMIEPQAASFLNELTLALSGLAGDAQYWQGFTKGIEQLSDSIVGRLIPGLDQVVNLMREVNIQATPTAMNQMEAITQQALARSARGNGNGNNRQTGAAQVPFWMTAEGKAAVLAKNGIMTEDQMQKALEEQEKFLAASEKATKEAMSGFGSSVMNSASFVISSLQSIYAAYTNGQLQSLQNLYNAQKKYIVANTKDEKTRDAQLKALDEAKEMRETYIKNKAARQQRELSIYAAIVQNLQGQVGTFSGVAAATAAAYPYNLIMAGAAATIVAAFGAAQIAAIASSPLPTAAFGGSFNVPPGYQADSGLVRVNQGERVDITPERKNDKSGGQMSLRIGEYEFQAMIEKMVNAAVNSGSVQIRKKGAVKVS